MNKLGLRESKPSVKVTQFMKGKCWHPGLCDRRACAPCGSAEAWTVLFLCCGSVISHLRRKGQALGEQTAQIPGGAEEAEMAWRPQEGLASAFFPQESPDCQMDFQRGQPWAED